MTKIKICGLKRKEDITYVNDLNVDFVGFVFAESKRKISKENAFQLKKLLSKSIKSVGVFANNPWEVMESILEEGILDLVQLHGKEDEHTIEKIQRKWKLPVIKSIPMNGPLSMKKYLNSPADYLLLDHNNAGSGKVFDWNYKMATNKPFFVAGGLQQGNVVECIQKFQPFGVDVSSGVEMDGIKNFEKMKEFVRRVKEYGK